MRKLGTILLALGASAAVVAIASRRWGHGTDAGYEQPNWDMNKDKTTKTGRSAKGIPIESASPIGHEEIERRIAEEAAGDGAVPEPIHPSKERSQERKPKEPDQPLNPRRQKNSDPE